MKKILLLFSCFYISLNAQQIDTTYGINGTSTLNEITSFGGYAIQPDGKILLAGRNANLHPIIIRLDTNGSIDYSFGTNGKFIVTSETGFFIYPKILPSGSIIVYNSNGKYYRLLSNGSIDPTFSNQIQYSSYYKDYGVLSDGKIVYCGDQSLLRYNSDGSLDTSFGSNGIFRIFPSTSTESISGIEIDPLTNTIFIRSQLKLNGEYRYWKVTQEGIMTATPILVQDASSTFKFTSQNLFISGYNSPNGSSNGRTFTRKFDNSMTQIQNYYVQDNFDYDNLDITVPQAGKIIQINKTSSNHLDLQIVKLKQTYPYEDTSFGTNGKYIFTPGITIREAYCEYDNFTNALFVIVSGGYPERVQVTKFKQVNLSINELNKTKVSFYPNPAEKKIFFSDKIKFVTLFSLDGKKINTDCVNEYVDISTLQSGIYILKYEDFNGNFYTEKLIKK